MSIYHVTGLCSKLLSHVCVRNETSDIQATLSVDVQDTILGRINKSLHRNAHLNIALIVSGNTNHVTSSCSELVLHCCIKDETWHKQTTLKMLCLYLICFLCFYFLSKNTFFVTILCNSFCNVYLFSILNIICPSLSFWVQLTTLAILRIWYHWKGLSLQITILFVKWRYTYF